MTAGPPSHQDVTNMHEYDSNHLVHLFVAASLCAFSCQQEASMHQFRTIIKVVQHIYWFFKLIFSLALLQIFAIVLGRQKQHVWAQTSPWRCSLNHQSVHILHPTLTIDFGLQSWPSPPVLLMNYNLSPILPPIALLCVHFVLNVSCSSPPFSTFLCLFIGNKSPSKLFY